MSDVTEGLEGGGLDAGEGASPAIVARFEGRKARQGTLGALLQKALGPSRVAGATDELARSVHRSDAAPFAVIYAGQAARAKRSDLDPDDLTIRYHDYSAPPLWATGVTILRVQVERDTRPEFLFHGGEEVLAAVRGGVRYTFARAAESGIWYDEALVHEGDIVRINPLIPHHAEAIDVKDDEKASVWMCMRAGSDSPYRLTATDNGYVPAKPFASPRKLDPTTDLIDPAKYACIAMGLSESIRVARLRADLTVDEVATVCGVDAALISRIENAHQSKDTAGLNISIAGLVRICAYLGIPLAKLLWQVAQQPYDIMPIPTGVELDRPTPTPVPRKDHIEHDLHFATVNVPVCRDALVPRECDFDFGTIASWIVLEGDISVDLEVRDPYAPQAGKKVKPRGVVETKDEPLSVTEGSVLHFRHARPVRITAAQAPARILQVVHGGICRCSSTV